MLLRIVVIALISLSAGTSAQEVPLDKCRRWQDRIDHYSLLRKRGGRAKQMENWRQSRATYEEKFRDNKCHRYGKQLN